MTKANLKTFTIPPHWDHFELDTSGLDLNGDIPTYTPHFDLQQFEKAEFPTYEKLSGNAGKINLPWLAQLRKSNGHLKLEDRFCISKDDGYWVSLPDEDDRICFPPTDSEGNTYVGVYLSQLEYGLRFPVHNFLQAVLREYHLCLAQITPQSLRKIIGFIWICEFLKFPLSMNLFRACLKIERARSPTSDWFSIKNINNTMTSCPSMECLRDWKDHYIWVRVPTAEGHPFKFCAPAEFSAYVDVGTFDPSNLNPSEQVAFRFFQKEDGQPKHWLPHHDYMAREEVLVLGKLSKGISHDAAQDIVDWEKLGISPAKTYVNRCCKLDIKDLAEPFRNHLSLPRKLKERTEMSFYVDPFDNQKKGKLIRRRAMKSSSDAGNRTFTRSLKERTLANLYTDLVDNRKKGKLIRRLATESSSDEGERTSTQPLKTDYTSPIYVSPPKGGKLALQFSYKQRKQIEKERLRKARLDMATNVTASAKRKEPASLDPLDADEVPLSTLFKKAKTQQEGLSKVYDKGKGHACSPTKGPADSNAGDAPTMGSPTIEIIIDSDEESVHHGHQEVPSQGPCSEEKTLPHTSDNTFTDLKVLPHGSLSSRSESHEATNVPEAILEKLIKDRVAPPACAEISSYSASLMNILGLLLSSLSAPPDFSTKEAQIKELQRQLELTLQLLTEKEVEVAALKEENNTLQARSKRWENLDKAANDALESFKDLALTSATSLVELLVCWKRSSEMLAFIKEFSFKAKEKVQNLKSGNVALKEELELHKVSWAAEKKAMLASWDEERIFLSKKLEEEVDIAWEAARQPIRRCFFHAYPELDWGKIDLLLQQGYGDQPHQKDDDWITFLVEKELEEESMV